MVDAEGYWIKYITWIGIGILFALVLVGAFNSSWATASNSVSKYIFFGDETLNIETTTTTGNIGGIITAFMIWLIIFVGFGDVLENFSAFSMGIGWIIAFAVAVVAANVGLIQGGLIVLVGWFAWAGTAAIFLALLGAFFAFIVVNLGATWLTSWIKNRQTMVRAASGKTEAAAGLKTLRRVGRESTSR